ncbi:MAG: hypothetical protein M1497_08125 [Nitrospirae bacterium]|nr:hypothetical protein [Nitrospirota bacterium]
MPGTSSTFSLHKKEEQKQKCSVLRPALVAACFLFLLFAACAPKRVEIPTYEGVDLREVLSAREAIKTVSSTFSIAVEKDGSVMKGEGVLHLSGDSLELQVYSLGFLVAEVTSHNAVTKSDPPLDRNRLSLLVDGIRNSFFWWNVKEADIQEGGDSYRISNSWRRIFVNKKTLMPEKQIIELDDGQQLTVLYEEPALLDGGWFPSRMRIEFLHQAANLRIKSLSFGE